MKSINSGNFVRISVIYKQHPAQRLKTKCQTGPVQLGRVLCQAVGNIRPQHPAARNVWDQYKGTPSRQLGEPRRVLQPAACSIQPLVVLQRDKRARSLAVTCQLLESPSAQPINSVFSQTLRSQENSELCRSALPSLLHKGLI